MSQTDLHIDGNWVTGQGAELTSTCPVDQSVVWRGASATQTQIDQAFVAARNAFGPWWDVPTEDRIGMVKQFASLVAESTEELSLLIARETGKPLWETRTEAGSRRRQGRSFDRCVQEPSRYNIV